MKTQNETGTTQRDVISTEILDNKTLLVISKSEEDEYPIVSVKYLENNNTHETRIARITPETTIEYNDRMVAVSLPSGRLFRKKRVVTLYDVEKHDFASNEFLTMNYEVLVYKGSNVKQLVKRK